MSRCLELSICLSWIISSNSLLKASQLWGVDSGSRSTLTLVPIDLATGAVSAGSTLVTPQTAGADDMASDPLREPNLVWAVTTSFTTTQLVSINPFTSQLVSNIPLLSNSPVRALAIDPLTGSFYGATSTDLYVINKTTGVLKLVGPTTISVERALGFDSQGNLFGIANDKDLMSVSTLSGAANFVATLNLTRMEDIAVDPATGIMHGLGFGYSLYKINLTNGNLTNVGPSLTRPAGMAFTNIPEPTAAAMSLLSILVVAVRFPKRRRG
ncbi:hypothetical protein [Bythopirellula polymerisocia]|nr:hypothetical protein [Bythopirellula polymerisocia]